MYSRIGRRNPLHTTAIGKMLLAWRDRAEVSEILKDVELKRSTANTIVSSEALIEVLEQVKLQRFGEDNEEQEEGLRCIVVPVFDRFGVVIAGLSISFPTIRFSEEAKSDYVAMLRRARSPLRWATITTLSLIIDHLAALLEQRTIRHANDATIGMQILSGDHTTRGKVATLQAQTCDVFCAAG